MDYNGQNLTIMDITGLLWTKLDYYGQNWTTMDTIGLLWTILWTQLETVYKVW